MAKPKRTPLAFNTIQLTDELKGSAGKGVDAFFSPLSVPPSQSQIEPSALKPKTQHKEIHSSRSSIQPEQRTEIASTTDEKKAKQSGNTPRNITILHLDETDITRLREA